MSEDDDGAILDRESEDVAMDTPQRKQINTRLSKFEVIYIFLLFNYLIILIWLVGGELFVFSVLSNGYLMISWDFQFLSCVCCGVFLLFKLNLDMWLCEGFVCL